MNHLENLLSSPMIYRMGWGLIHFLWQGLAIAAVLAIALAVLRGRSAGARHRAAWAALLAMAVSVPVTVWLRPPPPAAVPVSTVPEQPAMDIAAVSTNPTTDAGAIGLDGLDGEPSIYAANSPTPSEEPFGGMSSHAPSPVPPDDAGLETRSVAGTAGDDPPTTRASQWLRPVLPGVVCCWLAGILALSFWHLGGWLQLQRLRRRGTWAAPQAAQQVLRRLLDRLRVRRAVRLLESALVEVPTLIGWLRPAILLPVGILAEMSPQQLEMILAHELAHVRRYDYLLNLLQTAIETLLFYHPAAWWVSRRIRIEREDCCDDLVVATSGDRLLYARALASLEEMRHQGAKPLPEPLTVAADGGVLIDRIRRVLGGARSPGNRSARWAAGAMVVGLLLGAGVVFRLATLAAETETVAATPPATVEHAPKKPDPAAGRERISWGKANEGLRCGFIRRSEPVTAGTAPLVALMVENVGSKPLVWECISEITWVIGIPHGNRPLPHSHCAMPKFRVLPGPKARLATAAEVRRMSGGIYRPGLKDADPVAGCYWLEPGGKLMLKCRLTWHLEEPGPARVACLLWRRHPFGGANDPEGKNSVTCPPLVLQVVRKSVPELIQRLKHKNAAVRRDAALVLGKTHPVPEEAVPGLILAFKDENARVRELAVETVGSLRKREHMPAMIEVLKDKSEVVRGTALRWLATGYQPYRTVETEDTISAVCPPPSPEVARKLVGPFRELLNDPSAELRRRAAVALVLQLGDTSPKDELIRQLLAIPPSLEQTPGGGQRQYYDQAGNIIRALEKITGKTMGKPAERVFGAFRRLETSYTSGMTLTYDPNERPATVKKCRDLLAAWQDWARGQETTGGGRAVQEGKTAAALMKALKDKDHNVRFLAAIDLGRLIYPDKAVASALSEALTDEHPTVRYAAAHALGRIGPVAGEAIPAMVRALKDKDPTVRRYVAFALGERGPAARQAEAALSEALKDEDERVRRRAAEALKRIRPAPQDPEAAEAVPSTKPATPPAGRAGAAEWGEASKGVRCKLVPSRTEIVAGQPLTFRLVVQNVSKEHIVLNNRIGTRVAFYLNDRFVSQEHSLYHGFAFKPPDDTPRFITVPPGGSIEAVLPVGVLAAKRFTDIGDRRIIASTAKPGTYKVHALYSQRGAGGYPARWWRGTIRSPAVEIKVRPLPAAATALEKIGDSRAVEAIPGYS